MTEPTEDHQPAVSGGSDAAAAPGARRPVLARPHPNETVEEFSARFLAEILEAQQSKESRFDGD